MRKTILITGGAGFIGSHLCDFFLKKNYKVIAIDDLSTGRIENIKHLFEKNDFKFLEIDITNNFTISEKIDYILHFASPASPIDYLNMPLKTLRTGSRGTENILNIALEKKSVVLVASTSEVYGDPLKHPQEEGYFGNVNPIGPRSVYDEAKRYQEALTMAYHNYYGINIKIARIFNTYGKRMRHNDGRAIPNFINQALKNENFTIFGNGNQTRSFCYINDTVDAIYKLLKSDYNLPMNIGNDKEHSIIDLVRLISKLIPSNSKIIFKELPENDPKVRKPSIKLAKKILMWEPKIELKEGLKAIINHYKNLS